MTRRGRSADKSGPTRFSQPPAGEESGWTDPPPRHPYDPKTQIRWGIDYIRTFYRGKHRK